MRVFIEDSFDSAHWLPNTPEGHKCHRMHGHTYRIRLEVGGEVDPDTGWVIDYTDVKHAWEPVRLALDHHCLNDLFANPTCEVIAQWITFELRVAGLNVVRIELRETVNCGVVLE